MHNSVRSMRVSDADREAVVARLSAAAAQGRLSLEEFSDRTRWAYASSTWDELANLIHDLPASPVTVTRSTVVTPPATASGSVVPLLALIFGIVSVASFVFFGVP